jgi:type II secretory pathway component PulF
MIPTAFLPLVLIAGLVYAETARSSSWSLSQFTAFLASAVRRNLPLGPAVRAYLDELPRWRFLARKALRDVAGALEEGRPLADGLDDHPGVFPAHYRAIVRAAERGGNLAAVLGRLREMTDLDESALRRATGYALYPAVVAQALTAIFGVGYVYVVPRFREMFEDLRALPSPSSPWCLTWPAWGPALATAVLVLFGGLVTVGLSAPAVLDRAGTWPGRLWSRVRWRLPLVRRYERRRAVAQYALVAGRLLEAGFPEVEAFELAASSSASPRMEAIGRAAAASVSEGRRLSEALKSADARRELPPGLAWYAEVGEASGRVPEALLRASEAAFARARSLLGHMVGLIFPAGILLMALLVGTFAYAMIEPLALIAEGLL